MEPLIKVENLNVIYFLGKSNQVNALTDINIEIFPGEFIIFFGPSGCGKSTLLYSIAGLERNIHGNIFVDGKNLSEFRNRELEWYHQKKTGMIFQAFYLIPSLSIIDNIMLPQISIGASRNERTAKAKELMDHFGVSTQASKLPAELSGGQQQRVAICRSLVNDPDILLADEPVGNLDSKSSDDVMKLLKDLNEKDKKTVILVTHNPTHLHLAHRVFYIKDGCHTKTEVNKAINEQVAAEKEKPKNLSEIPKEIELLARTYTSISPDVLPTLLLPFKAKEIVSEALIGMTNEEIKKIEQKVEHLLLLSLGKGSTNFNFLIEELERFLDEKGEKGGMEFDKRMAVKIAEKVRDIVAEVKAIRDQEARYLQTGRDGEKDNEVAQIRHYLLENCKVHLKEFLSLERMNLALRDRLDGKIDRNGLQAALDLPLEKGGAGLDRRAAKKIAKRMELLVLGKYQ